MLHATECDHRVIPQHRKHLTLGSIRGVKQHRLILARDFLVKALLLLFQSDCVLVSLSLLVIQTEPLTPAIFRPIIEQPPRNLARVQHHLVRWSNIRPVRSSIHHLRCVALA